MVSAKLNPRARGEQMGHHHQDATAHIVVPRRRLELPRPNGHWHLKPARLPIPPPGHAMSDAQNGRLKQRVRIAANADVSNLFRVPIVNRIYVGCRVLFDDMFLYFSLKN